MHNPNTMARLRAACFFVVAILAAEKDIYDELYTTVLADTSRSGLAEVLLFFSTYWNAIPIIALTTLAFRGKGLPLRRWAISGLYLLIHGFYALDGPSPPEGKGYMHLLFVPIYLAILCLVTLVISQVFLFLSNYFSVIPAKAGTLESSYSLALGPRFRGDDGVGKQLFNL